MEIKLPIREHWQQMTTKERREYALTDKEELRRFELGLTSDSEKVRQKSKDEIRQFIVRDRVEIINRFGMSFLVHVLPKNEYQNEWTIEQAAIYDEGLAESREFLSIIRRDVRKYTLELDPNLQIEEDASFDNIYKAVETNNPELTKFYTDIITAKFLDSNEGTLQMRDALRDEVERRKRAKDKKRENSKIPAVVRFQTSPEITGSLRAISDGATFRHWKRSENEVALIHSIPNKKHETKLIGTDNDCTYDLLEQQLKEVSEPECALQSQFVFEAVLTHERAYLELDYLIRELGWKPHTVAERQEMRVIVYNRLCLLSQLSNHGERVEMYKDTLTNKREKIYGFGKLIYLLDPYFTEQQIKNGDTIPTSITIVAGDKLNQYRGNHKILQDIGNARRLSGLPTGQAKGEWAVSIGLALNYYWRQDASRVGLTRVGDHKSLSPVFNKLTRYQLLDMFPSVKFPVDDILQSDTPNRAQKYWDGAIKLLKNRGVISYTSPAAKLPRQGWQKIWLYEELLDIRPSNEAKQDVIEIAQSAQKKKKFFAKNQSNGKKA
jgi:hypothetical protein